ncbi:MAG: hypothetical protein E7320_11075 [Clostridiales bacterium]|nr:hypothetical protein [Clostridiales bacterium]
MRKILALTLCIVMALCSVAAVAEEAAPVKTGLSIVTSMSAAKNGGVQTTINFTAVTVDDNGVIDAVVIDSLQATVGVDAAGQLTTDPATLFQSKNELGDAYGMRKASSISAEWNEQAAAFAAYCVGKTIDEVKAMPVTETGAPADADLAAGCTMGAYNFLPGVEAAVANAQHAGAKKGDALKLVHVTNASGSKSATAEAAGKTQVYATIAAITLNGETITSCTIDAVQATAAFDATGAITADLTAPIQTKNQLGDAYGMRKASSISAEWNEQAAGFAAYITGKTVAEATGIAVDEGGYPTEADLRATTTMGIGGFIDLLAKIAQ